MSVPRKRLFATFVLLVLLAGSAGSVWRLRAQNAPAAGKVPVQTFKDRIPAAPVTNGDRGATYHALEREATRVTTRFADAIAVADRTLDGQLSTRLTDLAGNEMVAFKVHHVDGAGDSLEFTLANRPDMPARHAAGRSGVQSTLDWSNEQAYSLWKDRDALDRASLEWQDTLMRPTGAPKRSPGDAALRADTEWRGGFSATVTKKVGTHVSYVSGRQTTGTVLISSFRKDGVELGSSQWWPDEQAFAWSFPGLTADSYLTAAHLKKNGGWNFTPDMAWLNTQNLAFYQFGTLLKTKGTVSKNRTPAGWLSRLGQFIAPTVEANDPGCDGFHWLDGTIFRWCCDVHDACYFKQDPNCTQSSWWMWWTSWQCDACNLDAVYCFASGGGGHIYQRYP
jgi:hypothetical protein